MPNLKNLWDIFLLFLIPIGGGIPGGVMLAQTRGVEWPIIMLLYLLSDIVLACTFEPILYLLVKYGQQVRFLARMGVLIKLMVEKTRDHYGHSSGIFALIMIAFGVDPMTGRAVAIAAGHGFCMGWVIAIAGDMMYFTLIMVSTLWLKSILGDGTWTMLIIFAFMMIGPSLFRRIQRKFQK